MAFTAYLDRWSIYGNLGLTQAKFDKFKDSAGDYKDNYTTFAPEYTYNLGLRYADPSGWYNQLDINGVGYVTKTNNFKQSAYNLVNWQVGYQHKEFDARIYAKNLFDEEYDMVGFLAPDRVVYSPPREVGLRLAYQF